MRIARKVRQWIGRSSWAVLPLVAIGALGVSSASAADAIEFFESKIRPLLATKCYTCHTDAKSGGLRIDSRWTLLRGGNSGAAIEPGNPEESLLIQAVSHTHERLRMPPTGQLEPHEIEDLKQWIRTGANWPDEKQKFFVRSIYPLLQEKCLACHQEDPQGKLRLDSREAVLLGGAHGPAVVSGNTEESLLMRTLRHDHERIKMPPAGKLPDEEIALFEQWVRDGAVWGETGVEKLEPYEISEDHKNHWSFQPVARPPVPAVSDARFKANPVDRFIFAKLAEKGLKPAPAADKLTLLRRATYDLTGLPPSLEEIDAFLADDSPGAYEKVIERLLATRQYGERWGRHWLDLVRYADTAGDSGDFPIPEAYRYRDYVIDSFNKDKPYDQFVREQLAGDLLPYSNDDQHWEQTLGTGYIAISRRIGVRPETLGHIRIEDTLNNFGKTFLGLTVGCARCHNHKFDPIPTADYYSLYGIFDSSVYPFPGSEHKPHRKDFVYRVGPEKAAEVLKANLAELAVWNKKERDKFKEYQSFQDRKIADPTRTRIIVWDELLKLRAERAAIAANFPPMEIGYAIAEANYPHDVRIQKAGDPKALGAEVRRGFLQILGGQKVPEDATGSGRRELADWMADPKNPLTARVMVNRIWHYHFGRGIVATTSDFGVRGSARSHPELLDYLASYFVDAGWSIKDMHRLIMLSATYRLGGSEIAANIEIDPTNEFLWRANRRRLDAESLRDSIMLLSGDLDLTPGGRHPMPHHLTYFYRQHEPFNEFYESNRRTIYTMQQRFEKNAYLDLFDGPDGNIQLGERKSSVTSLQALFMMNSEFFHTQSEAIAERVSVAGSSTDERIEHAYRMILGRRPRTEEVAKGEQFLASMRESLGSTDCAGTRCEQSAWAGYLRAILAGNEFMFVD